MTQLLKRPVPGLAADHLAAFTTFSAAPEPPSFGAAFRRRGLDREATVARIHGLPSPALIMRGYRPREIEPRRSWRERLGATLIAAFDRVAEWQERSRTRQLLLSLDDRALGDIGISRATAQAEAELPFWRERR